MKNQVFGQNARNGQNRVPHRFQTHYYTHWHTYDKKYSNVRGFRGLISIFYEGGWRPIKPESEKELDRAIPRLESFELNSQKQIKLPKIPESHLTIREIDPSNRYAEYQTIFVLTNCGYICTNKSWVDYQQVRSVEQK